MKKNIYLLVLLPLAILIWSCECVVDADTNQIITPTEFANILFINAMTDNEMKELYVLSSSRYIQRIDTIQNDWTNLVKDYKKVGIKVAGVKNSIKIVRLIDTNNILFNSVLNVKKDSNYTFIAYGKEKNIQTMIKSDFIKDYNADNIYFRCYNACVDSPELIINITTEGFSREYSLKSGQASELSALPNGTFTIKLRSIDSLYNAVYPDITFSQGMMSNFLIKGSYKLKSMHYGIVTAKF